MIRNHYVSLTAWIISALALSLFAVLAFVTPLPGVVNTRLTDALIMIAAGVATWFVYGIVRQFEVVEKPRRVWAYFGLGLALWTIGEMIWLLYAFVFAEVPTPSWGDVAWLGGYPLLGLALLTQYRLLLNPHPRQERRWVSLIVMVMLSFIVVVAWLAQGQSYIETLINLFYPVADLVLAIGALWLARQFGGGAWGRPWQALLVFTVADALYVWVTGSGLYETHAMVTAITDTLYFSAYLALALACYAQYRLVKRAA